MTDTRVGRAAGGDVPPRDAGRPRDVPARDRPSRDRLARNRPSRDGLARDAALALRTWLASRTLLVALALAAPALLRLPEGPALNSAAWPLNRLAGWDSWHFTRIAEGGYLPPGLPCCDQAFFPGYPLLIRAVMPLVAGSALAAGLAVTALSGAVAAVALRRLALLRTGDEQVARRAVLYLAIAPTGIFLTAVYTEAMFLALSVAAWLAASRRRWWWAGLLAAGAATVRVNGLLLAAALAVLYAEQLRRDRSWRPRKDVLALLAPVLATGAYLGYLAARTGSTGAWQEAQAQGWARRTAWPWQGLSAGWGALWKDAPGFLILSRWADLVAVLAGFALAVALLRLRRLAEGVYVGLNVASLVCSTLIVSAPRYALLWFPGYLLLAEQATKPGWRWLRGTVPAVCVPLLGILTVLFATHFWVA